jgi:hypothetical protein
MDDQAMKTVRVKTIDLDARLVPTLAFVDRTFAHRYKQFVEVILFNTQSQYEQPHLLLPVEVAEALRDQLTKELAK